MTEEDEAERGVAAVGRAVRTALRNNATAYGYSITITVSYGLVAGKSALASPLETLSFGIAAALGFAAFGALAVIIFRSGRVSETGQIATISGIVDFAAVLAAVFVALGLSRIGGFWAWSITGAGASVTYLLVGGLDILVARAAARYTSFGSSQ